MKNKKLKITFGETQYALEVAPDTDISQLKKITYGDRTLVVDKLVVDKMPVEYSNHQTGVKLLVYNFKLKGLLSTKFA